MSGAGRRYPYRRHRRLLPGGRYQQRPHCLRTRVVVPAAQGNRYLTGLRDHADRPRRRCREAERIGLVSRQVPADDLLPTCFAMAERIAAFSRPGTELTKRTLWTGLDASTLEGHMQAGGLGQLYVRMLTSTSKKRWLRAPRGAIPPFPTTSRSRQESKSVITATDLEVRAGARVRCCSPKARRCGSSPATGSAWWGVMVPVRRRRRGFWRGGRPVRRNRDAHRRDRLPATGPT